MERMWRKVNHSFGGRAPKSTSTMQSTDTVSSAGGFGDGPVVVAVSNAGQPSGSTATGRRLAASGQTANQYQKSLSQHVLQNRTASSERRRRKRRKSRPHRTSVSCVSGGGGDNMSSSGGFYTIRELSTASSVVGNNRHGRQSQTSCRQVATSAPSGTIMMYPNAKLEVANVIENTPTSTTATTEPSDISLRQRAVAKLRMFNFHLNWDLHMTHCKPCGPRFGSSSGGNIITRRLCRNRRRDDNELYRSNSFKFERFERKECIEELSNTLQKQIAVCDDYSLPVDFVKKRPSSFDPCLADAISTNPENWTAPSPQAETQIAFAEVKQRLQDQNDSTQSLPPQASVLTIPSINATLNAKPSSGTPNNTIVTLQQPQIAPLQHSIQFKTHNQRIKLERSSHPPLPNTIKQASVRLIEGYSDPKDSKRHKKVYHKKSKRRLYKNQQLQQKQEKPQQEQQQPQQLTTEGNFRDKRNKYSSDSSAPKSSDDEDNHSLKVPELNSPDSISDDLVRPLPPQLHRSPRKLTVTVSDLSKRNPSPYYYSDILKSKTHIESTADKETKNKSRQSTASEPPQLTQPPISVGPYRKSTSLDVPGREDREEEELEKTENTNTTVLEINETPKRYSFTEEGVRIIRCDSPSTSTSEESDCSECLKRREWHAKALALVRKTCNVQPLNRDISDCNQVSENLSSVPFAKESLSMPPHRLIGPSVCACVASTIGDDIDEYFRPRSIFYVHPHGVHECADCSLDIKELNSTALRDVIDSNSTINSDKTLEEENDEMSTRTRQLYETAFDCKIAKSDDDLDEVDRITNQSVLLQFNNGNDLLTKSEIKSSKSGVGKNRLVGKCLKNSKNQAIQEQASNSGGNASGSGSPQPIDDSETNPVHSRDTILSNILELSSELDNAHIHEEAIDQQDNTATTSTSHLPVRGYTPSPPSTAPLPMKFPGKHDRFFINSIKSAPNLPSSNPAHPRLRELRLPIQASLQQQRQHGSSLGTSNENSMIESAYVNPPFLRSHHTHHTSLVSSSRIRSRPRSFVLESGRVLELRKSHATHHHHVGNGGRRQHNYSSTESIATSSSGGSMESLRSSTSEGNRSTSSSESRHSTSLSSHSSESGSSSVAHPLRAPVVIHSKLHILSPISDKSSQEPGSEISEQNKTRNTPPEDTSQQHQMPHTSTHSSSSGNVKPSVQLQVDALKKRKPPTNKTLLHLADEIIGSDSGISLHSREDGKLGSNLQKFTLPKLNFPPSDNNKSNDNGISVVEGISTSVVLPQDLRDLPFDMPKLRRRKTLQPEACTSGSATSVDLGDLPFDMPKLRRRLRANQAEINNYLLHSTESSGISQASSSHSMRDENRTTMKMDTALFRQNLTLNLNDPRPSSKFGSLDLRGLTSNKELNLNVLKGHASAVDLIDVSIPLERQGWYHGAITRIEAETTLRPLTEGSFLVRNCESTKQDYSLSLKGAKGFMHMRIQRNESGQYILGQFSRPFETVPDMIRHFCLNRLPVRGAEHMCLIDPIIAQIL